MNICVFCGAAKGSIEAYSDAAKDLARLMVSQGHTLVYGGGKVGLMGILADTMLENGGKVAGFIPDFLMKREVGHASLTSLEVVETMHERKKKMADCSDAFIATPGGWGTLDELAEILTWNQLGLIKKPVGLLNTNHFFDPLILQMEVMVKEGFLKKESFNLIKTASNPTSLLPLLTV